MSVFDDFPEWDHEEMYEWVKRHEKDIHGLESCLRAASELANDIGSTLYWYDGQFDWLTFRALLKEALGAQPTKWNVTDFLKSLNEEQLKELLQELETWQFRFCFGEMCSGWEEPSGCQYSNGPICKLVIDKEIQKPEDYCPLVRFLDWLKERGIVKGTAYGPPSCGPPSP